MNIKILDEYSATQLVINEPDKWNVVSIRDSDGEGGNSIDPHEHLCKDIIKAYFDDIWHPKQKTNETQFPKKEQIEEILRWSKTKLDDILVHCVAGISRSSAVAYLIACTKMHPNEAIKIINPEIHFPNPVIINLGAQIFEDSYVFSAYTKKVMPDENYD